MISPIEYIQLKAFARQDGLLIGCMWVATFACFLGAISTPELELLFLAGLAATPVLVFMRLRQFRDKVLDGHISYLRAVAFMMFTLGYASLILAAATFVYFYFFDNGMFMTIIRQNTSTPEMQQFMKQAGLDAAYLESQMQLLSETRPIEFAFNMLWNSLTTSFFMALLLGVIGKRRACRVNSRDAQQC